MIELTACSFNGAPIPGPSAVFDELGGTIGRADTNQLVLPDPDRAISRVHARVAFRGVHGYVVEDNGSNPTIVNGQPLGQGRAHSLKPGDELQVGGYTIRVGSVSKTKPVDQDTPFVDLFGDPMMGLAEAPREPVVARSVTQTWVPQKPEPSGPAALSPGHIPDDWDPFAEPMPVASSAMSLQAPLASGPELGGDAAPLGGSLDDMFGLSGPAAGGDPLGLLPPVSATFTDRRGSELNTPMPRVAVAALLAPSSAASGGAHKALALKEGQDPAPEGLALPQGAVLSWEATTRAVLENPLPTPTASGQGIRPEPLFETGSLPVAAQAEGAQHAPAPLAGPRLGADAGQDALLQALLQGLSAPGLKLETLTPDTMRLLGELLHESTAGAVGLLLARAAFKRELRAEQTMIVARENNPLKFSPSAPAALQQLLGPAAPGFMAPTAAVRDAFEDLQAHQLAVMAGMKAALEGVLQRFDPVHLESQLTSRTSGLAGLIPGSRKARLWELFQELFGQLGREAQDNFDELFGRAFVQAYEAQLERLTNARTPDRATSHKD